MNQTNADVDRLTFPEWFKREYPLYEREGASRDTSLKAALRIAWETAERQSLSQEAVRDEALEEAASLVWVDGEKPSKTWTDAQTGKPAFDPIQVSRMQLAAAIRALKREPNAATQAGQARYTAPFKMVGGKEEWVQIRFVSRVHIHDKPTDANPSPIRVILMHELERAQPLVASDASDE